MLVHLNYQRKADLKKKLLMLTLDVNDTFATRASCVYDVTDTDFRAQHDNTHGRAFATF